MEVNETNAKDPCTLKYIASFYLKFQGNEIGMLTQILVFLKFHGNDIGVLPQISLSLSRITLFI